ncbi:MAG TPA: SGNH/GDSL hydrolase family protein [Thermoanaerobaculia bacterium]|jgi:hypothetical protein|nr:SGNH/GDSL hydrolase family protein [Thermoanaerobaculia bacterium]
MPTSSSTSSSERLSVAVAVASFAFVLGALTISYELLVRKSEARYGMRRSNVVSPHSSSPKIDALVNDLSAGVHYAVYALGTSRTEEGIRSDVLDPDVGLTYNLGMSGSSALRGFEVLNLLNERPSLIIVGVTPMDFTITGILQGAVGIRLARDSIASLRGTEREEERGPAAAMRTLTYATLHGAAPRRRRSLGQWFDLFQMHGDVLKFINNADAVAKQENLWIRGFLGVPRVATPEHFRELLPTYIPGEYILERGPLYAQLQQAVAWQRSRGTAVVFVRIPLAPVPREIEDATGFDRDIRQVAARCGVRYIDGRALVGDGFINDRRNFTDGGHLNVSGATAFSRALGAALRSPKEAPAKP